MIDEFQAEVVRTELVKLGPSGAVFEIEFGLGFIAGRDPDVEASAVGAGFEDRVVGVNEGSWTLEALDGGRRTRATYYLYTDPGGSIPKWIANKANTMALPDLFEAIRKRAAK